jgi:hypothetical protein
LLPNRQESIARLLLAAVAAALQESPPMPTGLATLVLQRDGVYRATTSACARCGTSAPPASPAALPRGPCIAEEAPDALLAEASAFFRSKP